MPLNPKATIDKWEKNIFSTNKSSKIEKLGKNGLFQLLYGKDENNTSSEKEIALNEFFADIFDISNIAWIIKDINDNELPELSKLLEKYLKRADLNIKTWLAKKRAGELGNYALVLTKEKTLITDKSLFPLTQPNIIPARIDYKNSINTRIFEISLFFEDFVYNDKNSYIVKKLYSLFNNKLNIEPVLVDQRGMTVLNSKVDPKILSKVNLNLETINWDFIPVVVLKNDVEELPRISKVSERLEILNKYDEMIAILPFWEKGGILFNGEHVTGPNKEAEAAKFMKDLLQNGFVKMKPLDLNAQPSNLSKNIVTWRPESVLQTIRATRNDIWNEIKADLGIPNLDEVRSAQKTEMEIRAKQFLTSPIVEREKTLMINFLIELATKFLFILSECNIVEKFPQVDLSKITIDLKLNLNNDKNIDTTINKFQTNKEIN